MFVDKYYQVIEKKSRSVSFIWKASHILSLLGAVITTFIVACSFPSVLHAFNRYCILNSQLEFTPRQKNHFPYVGNFPYNRSFNNPETQWNTRQQACNWSEFVFLMMSMSGLVLLVFLIIITRGGVEDRFTLYDKPYQMVVPAFFIAVIAVLTISITGAEVLKGLDKFCSHFNEHPKDKDCGEGIDVYTLIYHTKIINVSSYIHWTRIGIILAITFWAIFFITMLMRIILAPDFKIVIYNIDPILKSGKSTTSLLKFEGEITKNNVNSEVETTRNSGEDIFINTNPPVTSTDFFINESSENLSTQDLRDFKEPNTIDYDMEEPNTIDYDIEEPNTIDYDIEEPNTIDYDMEEPLLLDSTKSVDLNNIEDSEEQFDSIKSYDLNNIEDREEQFDPNKDLKLDLSTNPQRTSSQEQQTQTGSINLPSRACLIS